MKKIVSFLLFFVCIYLYILFEINIDCIFNTLLGCYCPGCGITRMFQSIFVGDFYQAFRYNPLIFILLVSYIIYFIVSLIVPIKINKKQKLVFLCSLLSILIIYGFLRNLEIFSFLSPTKL